MGLKLTLNLAPCAEDCKAWGWFANRFSPDALCARLGFRPSPSTPGERIGRRSRCSRRFRARVGCP